MVRSIKSTKLFIVKDNIGVHANIHITLKTLVPLFNILGPTG